MEYKYTALVLGKKDVGETDRIYTMYTLEGGQIKAMAKGVRKPQAKLACSLESFTLADITVMRTHGLGKITGSIIENNFSALKSNYDGLLSAFDMRDLFLRLVDLEHCDREVFILMQEYLEELNELAIKKTNSDKMELVTLAMHAKLLTSLGYHMEVGRCVVCENILSRNSIAFSPQHGGVVCKNCEGQVRNTITLNENAVKLLRIFEKNSLQSLRKLHVGSKELMNVRRAIFAFVGWVN